MQANVKGEKSTLLLVGWRTTHCVTKLQAAPHGHTTFFQGASFTAKSGDTVRLNGNVILCHGADKSCIGRIREILLSPDHERNARFVAIQLFSLTPMLHPTLHSPCLELTNEEVIVSRQAGTPSPAPSTSTPAFDATAKKSKPKGKGKAKQAAGTAQGSTRTASTSVQSSTSTTPTTVQRQSSTSAPHISPQPHVIPFPLQSQQHMMSTSSHQLSAMATPPYPPRVAFTPGSQLTMPPLQPFASHPSIASSAHAHTGQHQQFLPIQYPQGPAYAGPSQPSVNALQSMSASHPPPYHANGQAPPGPTMHLAHIMGHAHSMVPVLFHPAHLSHERMPGTYMTTHVTPHVPPTQVQQSSAGGSHRSSSQTHASIPGSTSLRVPSSAAAATARPSGVNHTRNASTTTLARRSTSTPSDSGSVTAPISTSLRRPRDLDGDDLLTLAPQQKKCLLDSAATLVKKLGIPEEEIRKFIDLGNLYSMCVDIKATLLVLANVSKENEIVAARDTISSKDFQLTKSLIQRSSIMDLL
ncbi:hypothetical protein PAXRUDRAFT_28036 [Paxillus rubicundulus Ve08.2h10]|uniref:Uncharacterized protein n=1 Tax=Paxillus rubicundulus Ve08.2h10 TaxID=930991 RepID=A0A0D0CZ42_9AGAM|nr:hypothetical protein PAXRUDRAFT_28036 [Paxillus rubicundulus Ve08.2h10]